MITYLKIVSFGLFMLAVFSKQLHIDTTSQNIFGCTAWFVWMMTLLLEKLDEIKDAILNFKKSYDGRFDGR